ncbi:Uncharacterised protein [Legionella lansingensis]|uniref:Uncharacterized protein n=1 Tax=Legionella lansingensis TaxID=45067 RepID=A0A0W0VXH9_9GAMM|nr:hypothetical protein [Legionella lansingensis]KTD24815.1 hypothetical protein Llan_0377 [Legionella lansingensis]SNV49062.1 Uncharacterised protein [Legionella lansingensis]
MASPFLKFLVFSKQSSLKFVFIGLITIIFLWVSNWQNIQDAIEGRYYVYDQDAYMHLVIAADLLHTRDWHQHFNDRLNTPWGADTHGWTNVVTALLAGGAWLLGFFMPLSSALYLWSFVLPIIFYAIAAWAMLWVIQALQPTSYQQFFVLAAFLLNPFMNSFFFPLRVDYDFLLITLSIIYWGFLLRFLKSDNTRLAIITAVIASLGTWTSISFILLIFLSLAFLFYYSLIKKEIRQQSLVVYLMTLSLCFVVIIPFEHRHFFSIAHDILSIVHLTLLLMLTLTLVIYARCLEERRVAAKLIFICVALVIIFLVMNALFPGFYRGPYNEVDPYLLRHFFPVLSEFYSPFAVDRSLALAILCYFLIGAGYCYYLYLSSELSIPKRLFLWAAFTTTLLTVCMYRWVEYATPINILLVSFLMKDIKNTSFLFRLFAFILMVSLPSLILSLARDYFSKPEQICQEQFYSMLNNRFLGSPQFKQDKRIFVHSNYGPLLLYSTPFSIVASNDHHNPQGLKDSILFFKTNEAKAKDIVLRRQIDLILLCPIEFSTKFNPDKASWLRQVPLPKEYSQWRLYRRFDTKNVN